MIDIIISTLYVAYIVIMIHEGGHFLVAYVFDLPLARVEVGLGPVLYSRAWKGINFCFKLMPLGGFVKPVFESRRRWVNISIYAGGPAANLLTFLVLCPLGLANTSLGRISLFSAALNLIPWKKYSSDGRLILDELHRTRSGLE